MLLFWLVGFLVLASLQRLLLFHDAYGVKSIVAANDAAFDLPKNESYDARCLT